MLNGINGYSLKRCEPVSLCQFNPNLMLTIWFSEYGEDNDGDYNWCPWYAYEIPAMLWQMYHGNMHEIARHLRDTYPAALVAVRSNVPPIMPA